MSSGQPFLSDHMVAGTVTPVADYNTRCNIMFESAEAESECVTRSELST